ncbi:MAG TPA: SPOR domain-containing protein [Stellaceae bacterium]|nr:SPOR domain-containing protein [Stellaceae bacterium]
MDNPSETTSRFGGTVGAALLMAVLFALVLGVYGAVSIDAFRPARLQQAAAPMQPPAAAPQVAPPMVAIPVPPQLDQVNPAASRSLPAPLAAVQPAYWVEYGAYRGSSYADKLVARLSTLGIKAVVKRLPGAGGGLYFSVRSNAGSDRDRAKADVELAAQLDIAPLIRRGNGGAAAQPVAAKAETPANGLRAAHFWVQFGAYNAPHYALALRDQLHRAGVDASIVERHQPGFARYLVRSAPSFGRDEARTIAARSQSVLGIQPLIGRALGSAT